MELDEGSFSLEETPRVYSAVEFRAFFSKATTTVDGGWRVYLDLSELSGDVVAKLANTKGRALQVAIVVEPEDG